MEILHQELTFDKFVERMHKPGRECNCWSGTIGRKDWFGTDSFKEAITLLQTGWPDGAERLANEKLKAPPVGDCFGFTSHFDVSGAEVDVGRFLSGEHECMLDYQPERQASAGRIITLLMNASTSSGFSPEDFARRGLCALRMVDALESNGYRCDLRILQSTQVGDQLWAATIQIKEPDQPLDMDRIAFLLMHVAVYRRFIFRLLEQLPEHWFQRFCHSGGTPVDFPTSYTPDNAIIVPKLLLSDPHGLELWENATLAQYLEPEAA